MARSMNVGTIFVSITGNSADFRKAVKSARSEIFKLKRALAPIGSIAKTAGIALAGVGIAGAAMGKRLADDIDVLGKLSKSLRSSVGDLQAFKLAAELEGVDFTKATNGLKKLAVITGDISSGAAYSEVTDEWDKLGLKIEEVANLPATEQFKRITAAIREQIPVAEQLSVASAFFGTRNAADVMRITAETTEQATRIFKEYGIELTNARTKGVEEMNDAMTVLRHVFEGFAQNLVADYAPAVKAWVKQVQEGLKPGGDLRALLTRLADGFRIVAQTAVNFVDIMSSIVSKEVVMVAAVTAITLAIGKITLALGGAVVGLKGFVAAMLSAKTASGALGLVLGLGAGGLGGVLMTLVGAGGLLALGVAGFKALNTEMETATTIAEDLASATDRLARARLRMEQEELRTALDHARSEKRLQEIIAQGQGYISREQALKAQSREIADLEGRMANITRTLKDTAGSYDGESVGPLRMTIGGGGTKAAEDLSAFGGLHPAWNQGTGAATGGAAPGDPAAAYREYQRSMVAAGVAEIAKANREAAAQSKAQWAAVGSAIKSSLASSIDGMIDGTMKLKDLFKSLLKDMAKMAVKWAIFGGPAGGAGGLLGGLLGFASGGMHRGGARIVGERGPELEITGPSRIYSNADTRRLLGGRQVNVNVNLRAADDRTLRDALDREFSRLAPQIVEMSRSAVVSDLGRPSPANSAVRRI